MIVWDFGLIYFSNLLILWDFWIFWMLLEYDTRFFQFHEIGLLCDHQELACTSKDPPRRVDMKEMSLIFWGKNISWVIEKTVWKPTLVTLFENRICALIFWLNELYALNCYSSTFEFLLRRIRSKFCSWNNLGLMARPHIYIYIYIYPPPGLPR